MTDDFNIWGMIIGIIAGVIICGIPILWLEIRKRKDHERADDEGRGRISHTNNIEKF